MDKGKQLVEIVGCQHALHDLEYRLALRFHALALGNVSRHSADTDWHAGFIFHEDDLVFGPNHATVLRNPSQFIPRASLFQQLRSAVRDQLAILGVHGREPKARRAEPFFHRVTEHLLHLTVNKCGYSYSPDVVKRVVPD